MKARQIIFLLTIIFLFTFTSLPYSGLKSVYAQPPPPDNCGVWFPYVINASGFDTLITITGNAGEDGAELMIYFYGLDGSYQGAADVINLPAGEHSQWADILYHLNEGFVGSILMVTDMTDVRASGLIKNVVGTGALINTPAVIDYNISGVDENHRITGFPEPEESRTTLVFPHFYFSSTTGYDTGFAIGGPYYDSCSGCTATLYLYDAEGILRRIVVVAMDPATGGSVHSTYGCTLSQLLAINPQSFEAPILHCEDVNDGFLTSDVQGFMIAVLNFPYAQGCEFFSIPEVGVMTGFAATVDNDITDEIILEPWRLESDVDHSSIVLPCVRTSSALQAATFVTLANTRDGAAVTADIYLFDLDGSIKTIDEDPCCWQVVLGGDNNMPEMATIFLSTSLVQVNGVTQEYASLEDLNDFTGWMLIITDAPGSYAEATIAAGNNSFMSYAGQNDPDIVGVNAYGILRENPLPIDTVEAVALPYFANDLGFTTWVNVISTADWFNGGGGTPLPYTIKTYEYDGETLDDIPPVDMFPGPVLSASGIQQVPYQGEPATWGNNIIYGPPNLSTSAVLFTEDDIESIPGTLIAFTEPVIPKYLPVMPRGVANEQTITLIAPKAVTWDVTNNWNEPLSTEAFIYLGNGILVARRENVNQIELSTGPNPSAADNDVKIEITAGGVTKEYTITIVKVTSVLVDPSDMKTHKIPSNLENGKDHFCAVKGQEESVLKCTITPDTAGARNALVWKSKNESVQMTSPAVNNDKRTAKYSRGTAAEVPINIVIGGKVAKDVFGWVIWLTVTVTNQGNDNPDIRDSSHGIEVSGGYDFEYTIISPNIVVADDWPDLSGAMSWYPPPGPGRGWDQTWLSLCGGASLKWDVSCRIQCKVIYSGTCDGFIYTVPVNSIIDGEVFSVSNGSIVKCFEFDKNGAACNVTVNLVGKTTADDVRDAIITAVNGVQGFGVTASSVGSGKVRLRQVNGIVAAAESVANDNFVVQSINSRSGTAIIKPVEASHIADRETFSIFLGTDSVVFEFEKENDGVSPGHVSVNLVGITEVEDVQRQIMIAISQNVPALVLGGGGSEGSISVTNPIDIILITESVADENFEVKNNNATLSIGYFRAVAYPSTDDADGHDDPEPISVEQLDLVGNNDAWTWGEDNNPYDELKYDNNEPAAKGKIYEIGKSFQSISHKIGALGDKCQFRLQFKEFARIELNGTWYRCSDEQLWRIHMNCKKVVQVKWVDDPDEGMKSTKALDNQGW